MYFFWKKRNLGKIAEFSCQATSIHISCMSRLLRGQFRLRIGSSGLWIRLTRSRPQNQSDPILSRTHGSLKWLHFKGWFWFWLPYIEMPVSCVLKKNCIFLLPVCFFYQSTHNGNLWNLWKFENFNECIELRAVFCGVGKHSWDLEHSHQFVYGRESKDLRNVSDISWVKTSCWNELPQSRSTRKLKVLFAAPAIKRFEPSIKTQPTTSWTICNVSTTSMWFFKYHIFVTHQCNDPFKNRIWILSHYDEVSLEKQLIKNAHCKKLTFWLKMVLPAHYRALLFTWRTWNA